MSAPATAGALIGLGAASGLLLAGSRFRRLRRPDLSERVLPLLPGGRRHLARDTAHGPLATLVLLLRPGLDAVSSRSGPGPTGPEALRRRLQRAGRPADADRHRLEQVLWGTGGLAGGLLVSLWLVLRGSAPSFAALAVLTALAGVTGVLLHDRLLTRAGRRRAARISAQLPAVAELLAFAVAAGESALAALERVGRTVRGQLADEVLVTVAEVRAGSPLDVALADLAARCGSPAVDRFVDGIRVATERGTPLADVLRAQAADARAVARRSLLEAAGRKDVAMLVPVVFVVLPTVVLVALYPGIHGLSLAVP